jgi:hypothetical protein
VRNRLHPPPIADNANPLPAQHSLTGAMTMFAAAFGLHGIDHLRRGMTASPPSDGRD